VWRVRILIAKYLCLGKVARLFKFSLTEEDVCCKHVVQAIHIHPHTDSKHTVPACSQRQPIFTQAVMQSKGAYIYSRIWEIRNMSTKLDI
jgi:hypothetical protein